MEPSPPLNEQQQALVLHVKRQILQMRQLRQFEWSPPQRPHSGFASGMLPEEESVAPLTVTMPEIQQAMLDQVSGATPYLK